VVAETSAEFVGMGPLLEAQVEMDNSLYSFFITSFVLTIISGDTDMSVSVWKPSSVKTGDLHNHWSIIKKVDVQNARQN
jgi:hypothetical protein